ncbi:MAG: transcriptional regulator GcvA [Pelagimonas sp.]|jgi:LysR family glycine cleavage system transcriptional activator|nr:transcriptional regulator GcvA [Pelagimonas sp.]
MTDRLPPLNALRAFEAAARHLSFARAAQELNVTPAALSLQIRNLEDHLGQPLFLRQHRAVSLTDAGAALAPGCSDGFDRLHGAWRAARETGQTQVLSVTAGPAFTAKWLAPRLYAFAQAHPDIELRFAATLRRMDLERDGVDVAIRYGYGPDPDLFSHHLIDEAVLPMMHPDLVAQYPNPDSLLTAPLLQDDSVDFLRPKVDWHSWFHANGIEHDPVPAARFSQADHALDATLSGSGVVLSRSSLAVQYLARGQLVAPFDIALTTRAKFRVLCRQGAETHPRIAAFLDWLQSEVAALPDVLVGKTLIPVEQQHDMPE